jgi:hypothetical protein
MRAAAAPEFPIEGPLDERAFFFFERWLIRYDAFCNALMSLTGFLRCT